MTELIQNILILILTPISRVTGKLSERARGIGVQIVCLSFPFYFVYFYIQPNHKYVFELFETDNGRHVIGCFLLLLLILFSLDRAPSKVSWNRWIMYPMIISGIWMMVISFLHPIGDGYRAFAMMLIVVYPTLYFVWNNRGDYDKLFIPLSRALVITGILYFLYCFYLASKGELLVISGRVTGIMQNANLLSMVGMASSCGSLYLMLRMRESMTKYYVCSIALGMGIAIVLMGQSRISTMVCMGNILVTLFFYIRYCEKNSIRLILIKVCSSALIIVFMIMLSHVCMDMQERAFEKNAVGHETSQEMEVDTSQESTVVDRFSVGDNPTLDTYTAGRLSIWKGYMQFANLLGNDFSKTNWDMVTGSPVRHAHNNFVEMSYRFGVPMACLFILLEIIACLIALKFLFINREKRPELLLPVLFVVMFFLESMFDVGTLPFERDAPFYFYIALIPMVVKNTGKEIKHHD